MTGGITVTTTVLKKYLSLEWDMIEGNNKDILKDEKYYLINYFPNEI